MWVLSTQGKREEKIAVTLKLCVTKFGRHLNVQSCARKRSTILSASFMTLTKGKITKKKHKQHHKLTLLLCHQERKKETSSGKFRPFNFCVCCGLLPINASEDTFYHHIIIYSRDKIIISYLTSLADVYENILNDYIKFSTLKPYSISNIICFIFLFNEV